MGNFASLPASRYNEKDDANAYTSNERGDSVKAAGTNEQVRDKLKRKIFDLQNSRKYGPNNNTTVKRSNKILHALDLPTVINLNPHSVYNKIDEFHTLVKEEEADVIFMTESWEREDKTLDEIINLEDHVVISNVHQRQGVEGRPALIINNKKYMVQNLTQCVIQIPWGVEIVWAMITPKNIHNDSKIQKIILGSIYSKPNSRKKTATLDHITDVFNQMSVKFQKGLHFILAGDTNDLKLDAILQLSPNIKQVVTNVTRLNPPRILDPILTTLAQYYQKPEVIPPLDQDPDKTGKPSDHKIVKMKPINTVENKSTRTKRTVTFRPMPESGVQKLKQWASQKDWTSVTNAISTHDKAINLQSTLLKALDNCLPPKTVNFSSADSPWITPQIKGEIRKRQREFQKNRQSEKYKQINLKVLKLVKTAKCKYSSNFVEDLKSSDSKQWYSKLKRISSYNSHLLEPIQVSEISEHTDKDQAELIANKFSEISQEYDALNTCDIQIPPFTKESIPHILQEKVKQTLKHMKTKISTIPGDIPAAILKQISNEISMPLTNIINSCIEKGQWPDLWKVEAVTPIPKVHPTIHLDDLRNISGLFNLNKVTEKIFAELMLSDMKEKLDKSQYGNKKGVSIQHYLVKFIDQVLKSLDNNSKGETFAALAAFIDWKQAFNRQDPKLGIESFIENGVRPSLIPPLINYFQGRSMYVKWHGITSKPRTLNGGGPQGGTFGLLEYQSQSNKNAKCGIKFKMEMGGRPHGPRNHQSN